MWKEELGKITKTLRISDDRPRFKLDTSRTEIYSISSASNRPMNDVTDSVLRLIYVLCVV
jgi:hypothetical protein